MGNNKREPVRISVDEAKNRANQDEITILDVVDPGAYEKIDYQIEGAVRIDPREIKEEYERLPGEDNILAYCT
jgi:rhodanese-related sulfurtransferase